MLNLFGSGVSDEDLVEIKNIIGRYFADKLVKKVGEKIEEKGIAEEEMEKWLDE